MDIIGILSNLGFDFQVFLFNTINFAIIAILLNKFFFRKVIKTIEKRKALIEEGIANSENSQKIITNAEEFSKEQLKQTQLKAIELINEAKENARREAEQIKAQSEEEINQFKLKAKEQIENERKQMMDAFKQDAANLVVMATDRLLRKSTKENPQVINDVEEIVQNMEFKN